LTFETIIVAFFVLVSPSSARAIALAVAVSCSIRLDAVDSDRRRIDENGTTLAPNSESNLTIALAASSASLATVGFKRTVTSAMAGVTAAEYGPLTRRLAEFDIATSTGNTQSYRSYSIVGQPGDSETPTSERLRVRDLRLDVGFWLSMTHNSLK
jgi:hypothetical protein